VVRRDGSAARSSRDRAAEEAPAATQRFDVDPQVAEHRVRILGKQEGPVFQRDCALGDQGLGDPYPKSPCQMVVAETRLPDCGSALPLPEADHLPPWCNRGESLQRLGQPGIGEPVIAKPSMWLHGDQSAANELGQVFAGGSRGHATQPCELARGANPAVEERKEHRGPGWVRQERSDRSDVTIGLCCKRLPSRFGNIGLERADEKGACHARNLSPQRFGGGRSFASVHSGMRSVSITPKILYFGHIASVLIRTTLASCSPAERYY